MLTAIIDYSSKLRIEKPGTTFDGCVNLKAGTIGQRIIDNDTEELCDPFVGLDITSISFTNFGLESAFNGLNYPNLEAVSCHTYIPHIVK